MLRNLESTESDESRQKNDYITDCCITSKFQYKNSSMRIVSRASCGPSEWLYLENEHSKSTLVVTTHDFWCSAAKFHVWKRHITRTLSTNVDDLRLRAKYISVIFVLIYFLVLVLVFQLFFSFSFVLVLQYFLVLVFASYFLVLVSFQFYSIGDFRKHVMICLNTVHS